MTTYDSVYGYRRLHAARRPAGNELRINNTGESGMLANIFLDDDTALKLARDLLASLGYEEFEVSGPGHLGFQPRPQVEVGQYYRVKRNRGTQARELQGYPLVKVTKVFDNTGYFETTTEAGFVSQWSAARMSETLNGPLTVEERTQWTEQPTVVPQVEVGQFYRVRSQSVMTPAFQGDPLVEITRVPSPGQYDVKTASGHTSTFFGLSKLEGPLDVTARTVWVEK